MSKEKELIVRLVGSGWRVAEDGTVLKPCGSVRASRVKKNTRGRPSYSVFNVKDCGISRPVHVHKLVAFIKFGIDAFKSQIRHLNGNSLDNSNINISFGSGSDNMMDRLSEDRLAHSLKAAKTLRKLTYDEVIFIRESLVSGVDLARQFNVTKSTISAVRNYKFYRSK